MSHRIVTYVRFLREHSLLGTALSWVMILAMIWVVPASLWRGDWPLAIMATVAVAVALLPAVLRHNYRIVLPWFFVFLVVLQLHLHTFWGVWLRFYDSQWFWDKLLHLKGTMLVSLVGFLAAYSIHLCGQVRLTWPILGLFTVVFGNALGAWWEIVEFLVDKSLKKNTQYGLDNTMIDLINNLLGSLLAAGLGWGYLKVTTIRERRELAEPLATAVAPLVSGDLPEGDSVPLSPSHIPKTFWEQRGSDSLESDSARAIHQEAQHKELMMPRRLSSEGVPS